MHIRTFGAMSDTRNGVRNCTRGQKTHEAAHMLNSQLTPLHQSSETSYRRWRQIRAYSEVKAYAFDVFCKQGCG